MESKEITSRAVLEVGDLVRAQSWGWAGRSKRQGIIVKITGDVLEDGRTWREGDQWITILLDGQLVEMRPWQLKKVQ